MVEALHAQLATLRSEVGAGKISGNCKQTADWCFGQLPALYDKFCQTNESRYGDEISRRVIAVLKELAVAKKDGSAEGELSIHITERLRVIHEQFGLPRLVLRLPAAPKASPAKTKRTAVSK